MNKQNSSFLKTKIVLIFYKVVLPIMMVIFLLGVSSLVERPIFMGSKILDMTTRILLCLWFCIGYIRLPNLTKVFRVYPNIEWKKSDVSSRERILYFIFSITIGIGTTLVTKWLINEFLPIFADISLISSIVNGVIFALPLSMQYEVFKL